MEHSTICVDYGQFGQHVMNPLLEMQQCIVGGLGRYLCYLTSDAREVRTVTCIMSLSYRDQLTTAAVSQSASRAVTASATRRASPVINEQKSEAGQQLVGLIRREGVCVQLFTIRRPPQDLAAALVGCLMPRKHLQGCTSFKDPRNRITFFIIAVLCSYLVQC